MRQADRKGDGGVVRKSAKSYREQLRQDGVFYTPKELALKMKALLPADIDEVYDPTCGDGGLLEAFECTKYGAELDPEEGDEARERGVLVHIGDVLEDQPFKDKRFRALCVIDEDLPPGIRLHQSPARDAIRRGEEKFLTAPTRSSIPAVTPQRALCSRAVAARPVTRRNGVLYNLTCGA